MSEITNPLTAKYLVNKLEQKQTGNSIDRIGATLFNSHIRLTPHQIEAALFAFKSPLSKGCILADEVGLGKTIEAGIVLAQYWSEMKRRIIIVCPASLMRQWESELLEKFNLPSIIMDRKKYNLLRKEGFSNPFNQKNQIIICSYHMCSALMDDIRLSSPNLVVIDEAHKLRNVWTGNNSISSNIKNAISESKVLLLTATPIQNNVMDLYGLTSLIDDNIFGDPKLYKEKYQKDYADNLYELRDRLSTFTHRTLREQVKPYIKFTKRIPKTFNFEQTEAEKEVYERIRGLLLNSDSESYLIPAKQRHLLLMILCKLMGSSIHSIVYTLTSMRDRLISIKNGTASDLLLENSNLADDIDLDDDELYQASVETDDKPIDIERINAEIANLDSIIDLASSIRVESKYTALKDAITFGFEFLNNLKAHKKILIFTESRRTQDYIYDALISDGYDGVIKFNGSNDDDLSIEIYQNWCKKPENFEKLNNSKSVNMREAIIDYFRSDGKILIATGAGAEGLNLQFCSMVINYDLPWNPQIVEQRIGRCHRFGQKHDVAVINFLSSSNVVEQRIYELLGSKFRVFNEVFGSSDAILGTLEEGIDLRKSIIDIYTNCRTTDEINAAFDKIQEQYKDVIDKSIQKTKQDLLDNFDEDIQKYFEDILSSTKKNINEIELDFWRLTQIILDNQATFNEDNRSFIYKNSCYSLSSNEVEGSIIYNTISNLGREVIDTANGINDIDGFIKFDISNYPFKISSIENLLGKSGYLRLSKITITSIEEETRIFLNGFLDDGTPIDEEVLLKLFKLNTTESPIDLISNDAISRLDSDASVVSNKIKILNEERNNASLNDEIQKINKWAEDKIEAVQTKVEQMRLERKQLQKMSDLASSTGEKEMFERQILDLSKRIKNSWIELAESEDEIEQQRKDNIDKLRKQISSSSTVETIFNAKFEII